MCGICGIFNTDGRPIDKNILHSMTDSLRHRGPDDEGYYIGDGIGLGFRRLSIIDLQTGHQPLSNEDRSLWVVFNGELYNYRELRASLESRGHRFATKSDTETIVHLYEDEGDECVNNLRGMFAFAVWDGRRKRLFCARDRFGIKPFYYSLRGTQFVFGSEIKSVLRMPSIPREIDPVALDSYFAYGYILGDMSVFTAVRKLPAAHTMTIEHSRNPVPVIRRYWDIRFEQDEENTESQWEETIVKTLSDSVQHHMMSDVPLGAFLSGGIDSSSVVALMSEHSPQPIKTFTIGFREEKFSEFPYARQVAERYGTEHHEQIVEPESIELLPKLVRGYDQPFADSSAIPTYYVSKLAREHVTVVLSGDGGDELFAGYGQYPKLRKLMSYNVLPKFARNMLWGGIYRLLPHHIRGKGISYLLSHDPAIVGAHITEWSAPERKLLYQPELWSSVTAPAESCKESIVLQSQASEFVSRMQELDMRTYLPDDILMKVDIASMMHSLEVRVPILDHLVAELSFRIPADLKLKNNIGKYILKRAMRHHLPESILRHPKQGFDVPIRMWFKGDLRTYVNETLLRSGNRLADYLDPRFVARIVSDEGRSNRNFSGKVWSLLVFSEWLDQL